MAFDNGTSSLVVNGPLRYSTHENQEIPFTVLPRSRRTFSKKKKKGSKAF
jgi:hypothetical protein